MSLRLNPHISGRALVFAALTLLPLAGCEKKPAAGGPGAPGGAPMGPMPVSATAARQADVAVGGDWVGTIDGFVNAQIQPQVSGYLISQNYKEGAQVSKGQVLFQIDPRPFQAALEQAQGQLGQAKGAVGQAQGQVAQAQAQLGLAQINVKRDTPLADQKAIAQSQLDNDKQTQATQEANVKTAEAQVAAAQAQVASAQAQINTAKINLGFTQVRSLISGVAGQATTQVGNLVSPQSVLTAVSQLDPVKVYFSITDTEYLKLTGGKGDLLHSKGAPELTLTLANGQDYGYKGHIVFVDRQMNQQTGAIRIAAAFANPGNVLRPGQFGRITATTETLHGAVLVPQAAITELQGIQQIYTVGPDNKVHVVNVTLGPEHGTERVVQSGLAPGTQVILDNLQKLKEGVPVSPHAAPAQPAAAPAAGR